MRQIFCRFVYLSIIFIVIVPGISSAQLTNINSAYPPESHRISFDSASDLYSKLLSSFEEKPQIKNSAGRKFAGGRKVNSITSIRYLFNSLADSIPEQKSTETFDEAGRVIVKNLSTWSEENKAWILKDKEEWGYNKFGDINIHEKWEWNDKKELLLNEEKEIWVFNSQGNVIKHDNYRWDFKKEELYLAATAEREYYESGIIAYRYSVFFDNEGIPYEKTEVTYNELGREVKWDHFVKEEIDDELVHIADYFWEWDDEGNLLQDESYHFDKELNEWVGREKREFSYDADDKISEKIEYEWDSDIDNWRVALKTEISYAGSTTEISIESYWDEINSEWKLKEKNERTSNSEGYWLLLITYSWSVVEDDWIYYLKTEFPKKDFYINYYWDSSKNEWIPINRLDLSSENGTTYYIIDNWDEISNQWICYVSKVYKENEYGDFIYDEFYLFQEDVNECVLSHLESMDYSYDEAGKILSSIYYFWMENDSTYEKKDFIYNEDGDLLIEELYDWDYQELIWVLVSKTFYDYEEVIITKFEENLSDIRIYPNPVETHLYFAQMKQPVLLDILSIQGISLLQETIFNEPIDLQFLSPGVYFLILCQEGKQVISSKIIKR